MTLRLKIREIEMELEVLNVEDVFIHEEIIPELLESLVSDMRSTGVVRDPVILDSETRVVLDGMHRVAAAKKMGLKALPVCLADYNHQAIKIGCWYRVILGCDEEKFLKIIKLFGLNTGPASVELAKKKLEERDATAALVTARSCQLVSARKTDIFESYTWIKRIERALKEEKCNITYESEENALKKISQDISIMMVPCVTKDEVKKIALSGRLFAHKTTRHVIPARPVNIAVPLEWLNGRISTKEASLKLEEFLSKKEFSILPPGSIFDNRTYEEELVVFK